MARVSCTWPKAQAICIVLTCAPETRAAPIFAAARIAPTGPALTGAVATDMTARTLMAAGGRGATAMILMAAAVTGAIARTLMAAVATGVTGPILTATRATGARQRISMAVPIVLGAMILMAGPAVPIVQAVLTGRNQVFSSIFC